MHRYCRAFKIQIKNPTNIPHAVTFKFLVLHLVPLSDSFPVHTSFFSSLKKIPFLLSLISIKKRL